MAHNYPLQSGDKVSVGTGNVNMGETQAADRRAQVDERSYVNEASHASAQYEYPIDQNLWRAGQPAPAINVRPQCLYTDEGANDITHEINIDKYGDDKDQTFARRVQVVDWTFDPDRDGKP